MGWLKENWLDFVIFLLVILVAGAVVLYLMGVSPFRRVTAPASSLSQPGSARTPSPPVEAPLVPPTAPRTEPALTVVPLPEAPSSSPPEATPSPSPSVPPKAPPSSPPKAPPSNPEKPPSSPQGVYWVAVGAFADPENALRLQETLRAKGYRATLEPAPSGLTRVVVGPYLSEAEAKRVAEALAQYGAQVYRGSAPVAQGLYYQVGAFQQEENALAMVRKLKAEGLGAVVVRNGLYRVRVGPLTEERAPEVRARLEALGLSPLEVR